MIDRALIHRRKKITCKYCEKEKMAYCLGKYPNSRSYKFVDYNGKAFSGKTCPECQVLKMKIRMRELRQTRKVEPEIKNEIN